MRLYEHIVKRLMDIILSQITLIILSPLFFLLSIIIKLDSKGPAIFRQLRAGKGGKPFICYKFRTMYVNAPDIRNPDGSTFSAEDDPRVTRVGRFLRKTSLDELPQLINVLKGDMSLVGPRPDLVDQLRYYTDEEKRRLSVKPGITGLAQVRGRNSIPWKQRKQLDLKYVKEQSLWLDLRILLLTIPCVIQQRGVFTKVVSERMQ